MDKAIPYLVGAGGVGATLYLIAGCVKSPGDVIVAAGASLVSAMILHYAVAK